MLNLLGNILPRSRSNRLDRLTGFAEHDFALAFALDIDRLLNADGTVLKLFPNLGLDRGLIRQFLMQPQIKLFPGDLGRQLAKRGVRYLILRVKPRPGRDMSGKKVF